MNLIFIHFIYVLIIFLITHLPIYSSTDSFIRFSKVLIMTETKLTGLTPDIAEENINALKNLFPDVFTEDKIDFDKLKQVLGKYVDDEKERYNFTWNGKGKALRLAQTPSSATLRPCVEESKNWDTTDNLYIEGDNLEVLKLLQKSYYGKVKMIYIDPPYNTGKDFVYSDDFLDTIGNYKATTGQVDDSGRSNSSNSETSGRFHTDWINMVYPRLRLARNLLSEDGVIFISIDDNEIANLIKICNEIFGESNFLGNIIWQKKSSPQNDANKISAVHDYILFYCKNFEKYRMNLIPRTAEQISKFKNPDNDTRGVWTAGDLSSKTKASGHSYPIQAPGGTIYYPPTGRQWAPSSETFSKLLAENRIYFGIGQNSQPKLKQFLSEIQQGIVPTTLWLKEYVGDNTRAVRELRELNIEFDSPKPVSLIEYSLKVGSDKDSLILDFFSGSTTTAHAVMQLNAEDGGNRKFIMVQLPESTPEKSEAYNAGYKNICEIGKERIRRAGEKIKAETGKKDLDIGFKVFKLDSSNIKKWQPDADNINMSLSDFIDNYVEGRTEQDVVYEILLKMGLELTVPVEEYEFSGKKVYSAGFGALMICTDDDITADVSKGMIELHQKLRPEVWKVVFKDNGFATDSVKTNVRENLKTAGLAEDNFTTI